MMNDLIYWTAFFGGAALFCYGAVTSAYWFVGFVTGCGDE